MKDLELLHHFHDITIERHLDGLFLHQRTKHVEIDLHFV
jgi:hypothetical protein